MIRSVAIAVLTVLSATAAAAQVVEDHETAHTLRSTPGAARPAATLADMTWLVGRWKGTGLDGVSEEIWADPVGGVMMGMYRLVINGKPSFYEFMHLSEEQGSLALKLKHFNPDLTAWEEKDRFVTFPLVKLGTKEAFFSGLTIRLLADGKLEIFLALQQNGKVREERFELERQ